MLKSMNFIAQQFTTTTDTNIWCSNNKYDETRFYR